MPSLAALPFDLPPLVQRRCRPGLAGPPPNPGGHAGEGAELIDDLSPLGERGGPRRASADRDVDPEHGQEELFRNHLPSMDTSDLYGG